MRAIRGILIAIVGISLLSTPITAQTPQPAPTTTAAPAKEPLRTVAWNKIAGNWKRFKGSIKQRWGKLTKNEITQAQGRREALNGFIQARYGIDREAADRQIDEWLKTLK
jgi:uncharacterized protein YjbJ (UPF0337 family)